MSSTISHEPANAVELADERARGWARMATFLAANPDIAEGVNFYGECLLRCLNHVDDPASFMAAAARACVDAGGRAEKYQGSKWGGVNLLFGSVRLDLHADIAKVSHEHVIQAVEYTLSFEVPEQPAGVA